MFYKIFSTPSDLAEAVALELTGRIKEAASGKNKLTVALSGGNTPKLLFNVLAEQYPSAGWNLVHFFWGDERCVPPDDPESNYGMTNKFLFNGISIPEGNIHRIRGEMDPYIESERYSGEILKYTRSEKGIPVFDLMILGMGDDGHTASIFPDNPGLLSSDKVCDVALHPVSGQKRVTVTGKVINNADTIIFMVSGAGKAEVVRAIFKKEAGSLNFPAANIIPHHGKIIWFLDKDAGRSLI
jgi:6-phosphogluconolactonase